jgi:putative ABC transport system permease protein
MTLFRLLIRNLFFHWRGNLAVLLGAVVGAAVLGGALLVGDSLRGSLRERTSQQLNGVQQIWIGSRFIHDSIAEAIAPTLPTILMQGSVSTDQSDPTKLSRLGKVTILGIPGELVVDPILDTDEAKAIVSKPLAMQLNLSVGSKLRINVQKAANIPRSSVLGRRSTTDSTSSLTVLVQKILEENHPANLFSLSPSPATPMNLFLPLKYLQRELEQKGRVNAMLHFSAINNAMLNGEFRKQLQLEDWGIIVAIHGKGTNRYLSIESQQLLLEPAIENAVQKTAEELNLRMAPTFVYLINRITPGAPANPPINSVGGLLGSWSRLAEIPYSVIAAVDPSLPEPLGPFLSDPKNPLKDDEIVLVDWSSPTLIGAEVGKPITLTYFKPEIEGRVEEASTTFTLRELLPLKGVAADPDLTPKFPGITDRLTIADWDPPFPYEATWVGPRDDLFWQRHKTTPKGYVTLTKGKELWGSRFGNVTSIRLALQEGGNVQQLVDTVRTTLLKNLDPEKSGLVFDPIRTRLMEAGKGSTDFGLLFLAFSFFLILAALMLVGLLFRLNLDRRASEIGLLLATGFSPKQVRRMLLLEGLFLSLIGSLIGLIGASGYAGGMLSILVELWPTEGVGSFLKLHVSLLTLIISLASAVLMSQLAILWAIRLLKKIPASLLLNGQSEPPLDPSKPSGQRRWSIRIAVLGILFAIGLAIMAPFMPPGEPQAGTFFGSGAMLLTAALACLWAWMKRDHTTPIHGHGTVALAQFGARNVGRNPTRSLLTAALLASAAFILVAVESFRRQPDKDFLDFHGGSGGFPLMAETGTGSLYLNLNHEEGRTEILEGLRLYLQDQASRKGTGESINDQLKKAEAALKEVKFFGFRKKGGDDASCLNLYQATRPQLLGVPQDLIERGGFQFASTLAETAEEEKNPWLLLNKKLPDGKIPMIVEQNTAMWMLKKGLGDDIEMTNEAGETIRLQMVGMLKDSVFQSEVLISDRAFLKEYPKLEGFSYFLIDSTKVDSTLVMNWLSEGLGVEVTRTQDKVATYLAVVNTYLTTFQLLGGFGLLLGVLGLAVVLLRSIWERRGELALLRALGYSGGSLNRVVLAENVLLLLVGLGAGVIAAFASIAPHIAEGGHIPWARLSGLLGLVLVVGVVITVVTIRSSLRSAIVPALRKE